MSQEANGADRVWSALPGGEFLRDGLADRAAGRESVASLLIEIGALRLSGAGIRVQPETQVIFAAEIRLYRLLQAEHGLNAHSQYNAHLRRLGKLTRALELRAARA